MSIRGEMPNGLWKQITLTLNPWSIKWFGKARFFDPKDDPNIFATTTTYKCNEWLDNADLALFEHMRVNNPKRYLIEGEGQWGVAEGLIYDKVELRPVDVEAIRQKQGVKSAFGLDFGFTDPTAFSAMMVDDSEKKIYVFDEFYRRGVTNARIAALIDSMGYGHEKIVCDSASPKCIQELQDLGIKAEPSRKGRDSVLHGIQLLQNYTWIIDPKCENFYQEISNYAWEKDKFGKPTDKPEHEWSHLMDSSRYALAKVLRGDVFSWD